MLPRLRPQAIRVGPISPGLGGRLVRTPLTARWIGSSTTPHLQRLATNPSLCHSCSTRARWPIGFRPMPTKATTPLGPLRLAIRTYSRKRHALVDARKTYAPKYNRFGTTEHNAKIVIFSILGLNALVYLCWGIGQERLRLAGDDHFIGFMQRHFVTSLANYEEHRYWTLLTSCFSQMTTIHLAFNMFALYSFGVPVVQLMGARPFLIFYTLAGITSSIVSLVGQRFRMTMGNPRTVNRQSGSVGASGAVLATLTLFAMVYPSSKILLVFIPVNSQAAIAVLAAYDLVNLFKNPNSLIDSAGHLGGTMFGLGYYYLLLKPLITRL